MISLGRLVRKLLYLQATSTLSYARFQVDMKGDLS